MRADRRRLHLAVPALEVLPPQLPLEHASRSSPAAAGSLGCWSELVPDLPRRMPTASFGAPTGRGAVVREPVHETDIQILEQRPVPAQALAEAALERFREELCLEARHRPRPVGRVEQPRRPVRGGVNICSATVVIVIDLLDARRVPAKLVCQHTQAQAAALPCLCAVQPPLIAHRLPSRRAHEQVDDGERPRRSFGSSRAVSSRIARSNVSAAGSASRSDCAGRPFETEHRPDAAARSRRTSDTAQREAPSRARPRLSGYEWRTDLQALLHPLAQASNSASLVGKWRYTVRSETRARIATSGIVTSSRPRSARTSAVASRMRRRVCSIWSARRGLS